MIAQLRPDLLPGCRRESVLREGRAIAFEAVAHPVDAVVTDLAIADSAAAAFDESARHSVCRLAIREADQHVDGLVRPAPGLDHQVRRRAAIGVSPTGE